MTALQTLQSDYALHLQPLFGVGFEELTRRGVTEYLKRQLIDRQREYFRIGKKYGVTTIDELDEKLAEGRLTEDTISEDDYIELAELQKELNAIKRLIAKAEYGYSST